MEPLRGEDPRQVGRYRLVARLGSGGMGQVFLGFSPAGRPMAVKVVHPELARDKAFLHRFRHEATAARRVSGAYTASVVDSGEGDLPWLATTLVVGPSLADAVEQQGPLSEVSVWRLAAGLAEALAEVHACGLVHRDLKPSNVLLAADGPRVIDFGISRALDGTAVTGTGMVVGTPAFMSPEQATGIPVGPASDVFSFGGVLTFAATGSGPFGDGSAVVMIYRVVHGEPALTGLPRTLSDLVSRCLAKRPEDRPTLAELMEIVTASVAPAASATSFWPEALANFIDSYRTRLAPETTGRAPYTPEQAEPSPPYPREPPDPREPVEPADPHVPAEAGAIGGHQDASATVTTQRARPRPPRYSPPPVSPPPVSPPPMSPRPLSPPPVSRPARGPRRTGTLTIRIGALAAAVVAAAVVLATVLSPGHPPAGGGTNPQPPDGFGTIPAESGTPHAGTVSFAEPSNGKPTSILPITNNSDYAEYDVLDFDYEMWRPLYWTNMGVSATIDPLLSLAKPPAWSNGGKTVTIAMNPRYKWSDGQPLSARDVVFSIDLIKAAVKENTNNWAYYLQDLFPNDVASMSTPNQSTLVLNLTSAVNPNWLYEEQLATVQPMPEYAWAKASADGPILDFSDPANAKKIYDYLSAQSKTPTTWTANPLWRIVDGPYKLASFNASTGADTMVANPSYGGPDSHEIRVLHAVPFTSDATELQALQTGSIDVGYVPYNDAPQVPRVRSHGYAVFGYPGVRWTFAVYNFKDTTGNFNHIAAQLYFRQAMAHLQDQQQYIRAFMYGAGSPAYGPIASIPANRYMPDNAKSNPYPFSVAAARSLLASYGWRVIPNGADTCERPGSGTGQCGAGIPAGTRLAFNLVYDNTSGLTQQLVTALAAAARQAGIAINLQASSYADIISTDDDATEPANANKWAMEDFGGFRPYPYLTTTGVFNTDGGVNFGGYSDPQADKLINASVRSRNPDALKNEASYLTVQQPGLFQPNIDVLYAWKKTLSGPADSFASLTQSYFTPEVWYFTK